MIDLGHPVVATARADFRQKGLEGDIDFCRFDCSLLELTHPQISVHIYSDLVIFRRSIFESHYLDINELTRYLLK